MDRLQSMRFGKVDGSSGASHWGGSGGAGTMGKESAGDASNRAEAVGLLREARKLLSNDIEIATLDNAIFVIELGGF